MKLKVNKLIGLVVVIITALLASTWYQIQLQLSGAEESMNLKKFVVPSGSDIQLLPEGNIFNVDRVFKQQTVDSDTKPTKKVSKDDYRLVGVFISGEKKEALFSYQGKSVRFSQGDLFAPFGTVIHIEDNLVKSSTDDGQTYEWEIFPVSASPKKEDNKK